ncbi:MAG: AI-2E family transporter [Lachnospiraceae bacterium]|nr:AI-2E family transporter [Lachnospiraceae bacterium]
MENNTSHGTYKWILTIAAACILLCFGAGNIDIIAGAIAWLTNLIFPLLLGLLMALIFNVIMYPIEQKLFSGSNSPLKKKARRPLAIFLTLLIIFGIFISIAFLIIPELISGVKILLKIIEEIINKLSLPENALDFSSLPIIGNFTRMDTAVDTIRTIAGCLIDFFIGLVFSVYLLANKEKLRKQITRLANAWLPIRLVQIISHITYVCTSTFRHFIIGQATEAVILGSLCAIGMWLLQIPYAAMVGSLVGVTALLPMVGAFIGAGAGAFIILTESPVKALIFIVFLVILQQIEGNLIYPRVVGSKIHFPAMWVLASIIIGGSLAGPMGMLIGVPIASSAYALLKEATEKREQNTKI